MMTHQIVKARVVEAVEPISEESDIAEALTDEACQQETPELSIEELEEIFHGLN